MAKLRRQWVRSSFAKSNDLSQMFSEATLRRKPCFGFSVMMLDFLKTPMPLSKAGLKIRKIFNRSTGPRHQLLISCHHGRRQPSSGVAN